MKNVLEITGAGVGIIVLLLGLTWIVQGNDFFLQQYFAPKQEQVRRKTFEESKAYIQGTVQDLQRMRFEYIKADPEHKAALAKVILHAAADFPEQHMPQDLREFIRDLKRQQTMAR